MFYREMLNFSGGGALLGVKMTRISLRGGVGFIPGLLQVGTVFDVQIIHCVAAGFRCVWGRMCR